MPKIQKAYVLWEDLEQLGLSTTGYTESTNSYTKEEIDDFFEGEDSGKKQVHWDRVTNTPASYTPSAHASSHESGGSDQVDHDSLSGYVAAEHVSLPNTMANVLSSYDLDDLDDVVISSPENGDFLQYFSASSEWKNIADPPPATHASTHHSGGGDQVNHDSLLGFVAAEHLSLPNTIANVLSDHNKAAHDSLDIDARYIDGQEVVAATPTDGNVLTWVDSNSRWEDVAPSAGTVEGCTDTNISSPENGDFLQYFTSDSKWHNVADPAPTAHASSHESAGADQINHDSLTGFVAAEHKSLPNTIAEVLSDHNVANHNSLGITTLGSGAVAQDHGTPATDMLVNVCYGTGSPPTASTTTEGTLFIKYTA